MKRIYTLIVLAVIFAVSAFAQTNPNRLIVVEKTGYYQGYLVERIDSIMFTQVEGPVKAEIDFHSFASGVSGDTIWLGITRTPECQSFQISVFAASTMAAIPNEAALAKYISNTSSNRYYQDFEDAQMTGFDFEFKADTEYTIATLGYDKYGIPCGTDEYTFRTPKVELVGNPQVMGQVDYVTTNSFTITFTPNEDVASYYYCCFGKGELESQFAMFGAWMGFANMGEMVAAWGIESIGMSTYTWTSMSPGTDYEVWVQALDDNGTYAPLTCVPVSTDKLGGEGVAEVYIQLGDWGGNAETGYYQYINFTANPNCALFHVMLVTKEAFDRDWTDEVVLDYLKQDTNPWNPWDLYWDLYGSDYAAWGLDPATTYYAFAVGKNILNEWGPMSKLEFTTPTVDADQVRKVAPKPTRRNMSASSSGPVKLNQAILSKLANKNRELILTE